MSGTARLSVLFFVVSFALALGLRGNDLGQIPWFVSRASGLVAFLLLTGSVLFGLLMSTRASDGVLPRPAVFAVHQFTSVLTLSLLALHAASLLFDGFLHFTPLSLLVPFVGPYRPLWVGLGVAGAWSTAIVTGSFWARRRLGQRSWRRLHYLSFFAWTASLVHGFAAGTDTQLAPVLWMYVLCAGAVASLVAYRIGAVLIGDDSVGSPRSRPAPQRAQHVG